MIFFKSILILLLVGSMLSMAGCSATPKETPKETLEEKIRQEYIDSNRLEKFYELKEEYGNRRVILLINAESDSWWITNFTLLAAFSILPDIPDVAATGGGVVAFFYFVGWWLGVTLIGSGIWVVLVWIGGILGGIPSIAPIIGGIIFLGAMFACLSNFFIWLF